MCSVVCIVRETHPHAACGLILVGKVKAGSAKRSVNLAPCARNSVFFRPHTSLLCVCG